MMEQHDKQNAENNNPAAYGYCVIYTGGCFLIQRDQSQSVVPWVDKNPADNQQQANKYNYSQQ